MKIKGRGFPLEYYPGEILTEREAGINRKMFLFRVTGMGGALTPNVSVMLPSPPSAINRIQFTSLDSMVSQTKPSSLIAPVRTNQPDKSILTDLQLDEFNQISSKFLDGSISMDEAILQLRGGSLTIVLIGNAIFLTVLYGIWILSGVSQGFVTPPQNPGWGFAGGMYDPPGLVRPIDCGTQLYAGSPTQSLKTWEDRNEPNPKDRWFLIESRPELVMRRGQSKFKPKDHGALAGLPYSIKKNGSTSTLKTEENVDILKATF